MLYVLVYLENALISEAVHMIVIETPPTIATANMVFPPFVSLYIGSLLCLYIAFTSPVLRLPFAVRGAVGLTQVCTIAQIYI